MNALINWAEYTLPLSNDPSCYGDVTIEQAAKITEDLTAKVRASFPGLNVEIRSMIGSFNVTGPDQDACDQVREWVENNWTSAL